MIPEINIWAVLLATLSSMVVGSVWYTPKVFGNYWMRVAKVSPSGEAKDAVKPILITLVVSFISAWSSPDPPPSRSTSTAATSWPTR